MSPAVRGWFVPLLVAVVLAAVVLGVDAAMTGGSRAGVGPDDGRATELPALRLPTVSPRPVELPASIATLVGYRADGRAGSRSLTLTYQVDDRSCTLLIVDPAVRESPSAVTITLRRAVGSDRQLYACPEEPYLDTIDVDLRGPLGSRTVRDAVSGAVVPAG